MANFTDGQVLPYLTQQTPYVAQQPVQAMVEVGRVKQQQYDQGVQRIQGEIDKIAGLDVVRDVDRKYLQSKLNTLNSDLKTVAAGDFSNFQLVNSVGGMINSIAKDSNVQNAVSSTTRYRKGVSEMESSIKEGKSSPSNEWDFQMQSQEWLNNPDVKASFSGSYNPYTNYKKNALEVIKSMKPDANITEDAFTIDGKGNVTINDAIIRKEFKGIAPEKIQQALLANLTPGDFKQMEIDGRYNYSNISPEQLNNSLRSSYSTTIENYNSQKKVLENALSSTTSVPVQNELRSQIANLDKSLGTITREQEQLTKALLSGDSQKIEGVKAQLQTNEFLNNFSRAFSYTETSEEYKDSPFVKNAHWKAEQDWDRTKFWATFGQKQEENRLKQEENNIKNKQSEPRYGGLGDVVPQNKLPEVSISRKVEDTIDAEKSLFLSDEMFYKLPSLNKDKEWFDQQLKAYNEGKPVGQVVKKYIEDTQQLRTAVSASKGALTSITNEVAKELGIENIDSYLESLIPSDAPDVYGFEGNVFTAKDFINFNIKNDKYISSDQNLITGFGSRPSSLKFDLEKAKKELSPLEYKLLEIQSKNKLSSEEKDLWKVVQYFNEKVNIPAKKTLSKIDELSTQKLKERTTSPQGVLYTLDGNTPKEREENKAMLAGFVKIASDQKDFLANSSEFTIEAAQKLIGDNEAQYKFSYNEGTTDAISGKPLQEPSYTVSVIGKDESVKFNVTPEQYNTTFAPMFQSSQEEQYVKPFIEQLRFSGGLTTSIDGGPTNPNNAFISKSYFTNPNLNYYGLNANIEAVGTDRQGNDLYVFKLNVFDPIKKEWIPDIQYPSKGAFTKQALGEQMNKISTGALFSLINGVNMTAADEKKLKEESQKPF